VDSRECAYCLDGICDGTKVCRTCSASSRERPSALLQGFVIVVAVLAGIMTGSLLPDFPFWGGCTAGILVYAVLAIVLDTICRHGFSVRVTR
jgi:hypothetical protein